MTLDAYLKAQRGRHADLARVLKVSPGALSDIRKGRARPSLELAARIEAATCGVVTMQELAKAAIRDAAADAGGAP